jgi:hypothetical protein
MTETLQKEEIMQYQTLKIDDWLFYKNEAKKELEI